MNEKIKNVLESIGFKNSYLERDSENEECVVYNYFSYGRTFADNKEIMREYTIHLNVYSNKRIDFRNETVRNAMLETGSYNSAIKFKGFI